MVPPVEEPAGEALSVQPGGTVYLLAVNEGTAPGTVELAVPPASGLRLNGGGRRRVAPGQAQPFALTVAANQPLRGAITVRCSEGSRAVWWERETWIEEVLPIRRLVRVITERWVPGASTLLFPPGVQQQFLRVWNDSPSERPFDSDTPAGYRVRTAFGSTLDGRAITVGPANELELAVQAESAWNDPTVDREWSFGPDADPITLVRMGHPRAQRGADVVVAIDFGTRNTRVRVRWRRSLVSAKPAGTVDEVGDTGQSGHFPTEMVLHVREETFRWGSEAAEQIIQNRLGPDEVAITNLKTYLREGEEAFTRHRPEWTNEELLRRFLAQILNRLDQYFLTADPNTPLRREDLHLQFVLCRPVLDTNAGDQKGQLYELTLKMALAQCGVPEEAIRFVLEPVAAAVALTRSYTEQLLALPDGAPVAVVDSGGGTTDIAVGRKAFQQGQVALDLAGTYALHLGPENPAQPALRSFDSPDQKEVGGNTLDCTLAYTLATRADLVLESDEREIPSTIWQDSTDEQRGKNEFVVNCRTMKERFAHSSMQYLNRTPDQLGPGEVTPFPTRDDLRGVFLDHLKYAQQVVGPVLQPAIQELRGEIHRSQTGAEGVRPDQVRWVFYVGGTCIDQAVCGVYHRAFPQAHPPSSSPSRIDECLHAVVDGAVWADEQLLTASPLTLTLRLPDGEHLLLRAGATLLPRNIAPMRPFSQVLEPREEWSAALLADGGNLEAPVEIARAFYRNAHDDPQEIVLQVRVDRERGITAELSVGSRLLPQWRVALVETSR